MAWLVAEGVTHASMEATGVYWMPVFQGLEANGSIEPVMVNARHARNVSGRKTDVNDAEWLGRLIRHGLLKNSHVPDKPILDLRDLVRYRGSLVETLGSELQRLIKLLEAAGFKLAGVLSDVFGHEVLDSAGLVAGNATARQMAAMTEGNARKKSMQIEQVLAAQLEPQERMLLSRQLCRVELAKRTSLRSMSKSTAG